MKKRNIPSSPLCVLENGVIYSHTEICYICMHKPAHAETSKFISVFCSVSYPSLHPSERNILLMPWRIFDSLMRASGHLRMRIDLRRPFKISNLIFVILGSTFLRKITIQVETHPFNHCLLMKQCPLNSKRIFIDIK